MAPQNTKTLLISSPSFVNGHNIPEKFTCTGININPGLDINGIPEEAESLAIIMEDPDAPGGMFDHWVIWNIPIRDNIQEGTKEGVPGRNSSGKTGYMGPCPPSGTHRYFFKVYAVNRMIDAKPGISKLEMFAFLKDRVVAFGELKGLYVHTVVETETSVSE